MKVFLDTGAFLALADEDDQYHSAATPLYTELLQTKAQLFTSNFILSETYTLIRFKVGHKAAIEFMKTLDQTGVKVLRVSEAIEQTAKAIFVRYHDKDFSFADIDSTMLSRSTLTFASTVSKGPSSFCREILLNPKSQIHNSLTRHPASL